MRTNFPPKYEKNIYNKWNDNEIPNQSVIKVITLSTFAYCKYLEDLWTSPLVSSEQVHLQQMNWQRNFHASVKEALHKWLFEELLMHAITLYNVIWRI